MKTLTPLTKSPRALAREALELARAALPPYSAARSRRDFTSHQLFATLALKTDSRGVVAFLADFADLREDLGPEKVTHYSTLNYAEQRRLKWGASSSSSCAPPRPQPTAA